MIYLRPSRKGATLGGGRPSLVDNYLDNILNYTSLDNSHFRFLIEASNGLELGNGVKETLLSAHLFAHNGSDMTMSLMNLTPIWEVKKGQNWEQVATGWKYKAVDRNEFRSTYRVRVTELDILRALGEQITEQGIIRLLDDIVVEHEVTITSSLAIIHHLNSDEFQHTLRDGLKADAAFIKSIKGEKGDKPIISFVDSKLFIDGIAQAEFNRKMISSYPVEELEQIPLSHYYLVLQTMISSETTDAPISYCVNTYQGEEIKLLKASSIPLGSRLVFRCIGKKLSYCPDSETRIVDLTARSKIISEKKDVYSASSGLSIYDNSSEPWGYKVCEFKGIDWRAEFIRSQDSCGTPIWIWTNYNDSHDLKMMSEMVATQVNTTTGQQQTLDVLKGEMRNTISQLIDVNNLSIDNGQRITNLTSRTQNLENQVLKKGEGLALGFINLLNYNGGVYTVKETDYHILARKTGNGDAYPYIKVSENLPHGHRFIVDMPYSECRVRLVLPSGGVTWGNGGIEWTHGHRYEVVKSNSREWGVIKTAYA